MFKKVLTICAVVATSSTVAFANVESAPYLGASVGVASNTTSVSNYTGFLTSLFGGYGALISQSFYLGGELFANLGSANISDHTSITSASLSGSSITTVQSTSAKTTYGFGASIIPGVMVNDHTMGYMRAGVVRSRFTSANQTATGGQLGLGMQTNVTQNWDIRGEYTYTSYNSVTGIGSNPRANQFNLGAIYKF